MRQVVIVVLVGVLLSTPARAQTAVPCLSPSPGRALQVLPLLERQNCGDSLIYNYDGGFENAVAWAYGGVVPPYYGAFGESYDLGPGIIQCASYWVTQVGDFNGQTADCYVWDKGITEAPGAVLAVVPGVVFENVPFYPGIGRNDVEMGICVSGEFTVGYWGDWPGEINAYWCAVDLDAPDKNPWTCIAPGIGYPTGWQRPTIVWG